MKLEITVRSYPMPPVELEETLRYMGGREWTVELRSVAEACVSEWKKTPPICRVCACEIPLFVGEGSVKFPFGDVASRSLSKRLEGCDRGVIFAATVGLGVDRLIAKYARISPVRALCFQGLGTQQVEALCDAFCEDVARKAAECGEETTERFSPGYGDLPLSLQRDVMELLDCSRRIGVTLNDTLLMSPTKSVTAIFGVRRVSH